jgi:tetratricopeptide (TPR) repeat protein
LLAIGCGGSDPIESVRGLHAKGLMEESLEPLRGLLESRPEDPEVHYLYGLALTRSGQPSLGRWSLHKAMEDPTWLTAAGIEFARGAVQTSNHAGAIEALARVLTAEPDNIDALVLSSIAKVSTRRDYEGALEDAERALALDPDELEAVVPRAQALLGLGRVEEAGEALEDLARRFDEQSLELEGGARYCTARASFAKEKGEPETADQIYGECLERYPTSEVLVQDAIAFYDAEQRFYRAIEILRAALKEAPDARSYRLSLVPRLQLAGLEDEAEETLRKATQSENQAFAAGAWVDLASYYMEREEFDKGVEAFERMLEVGAQPGPEVLFAYADALTLAGDYDGALGVSQQFADPSYRALIQGRVHLQRGEPVKALEWFDEGLRGWPNNPIARYYAAIAAESAGQYERAIAEYRYAVRAKPGGTDAGWRLGRLHAAEGDYDLALVALGTSSARSAKPDLASALLELEIRARLGNPKQEPAHLASIINAPEFRGRALAALASGARQRAGPEAAAEVLQSADSLDLTLPSNAPALRALVLNLADAGRVDEALAAAEASARAQSEVAAFQAIRGLALAAGEGTSAEVRAAYQRALELEPENAEALAGLARLAANQGDAEEALDLYDRASAAGLQDSAAERAAAELMIGLGRAAEARSRLEALLREHPFEIETLLRLAELRASDGAGRDVAIDLARRAQRFGGDPAAQQLLDELGAEAAAAPSMDPGE